jgi:Tol biopolymer transport system component
MRKIFSVMFYLVMILNLVGCSIDLNQPAIATSPVNNSVTTLTSTPATSTGSVTWGGLNLTGHLVYSRLSSNDDVSALSIETLDLTTGETKKVFTAPEDAWIYYSSVSPDGKQLIISYVAPSASNPARNQALYRLPMDGSAPPQLLVKPPAESDQYIQAEWSPDGKYVYYVHYNYKAQSADQIYPIYEIYRMAYPDGQPEQIVQHAFWPRVSPDSSRLVYVSLDPISGASDLWLANADGANAQVIKLDGAQSPSIKDAPFFSPDGQTIIFSAPSPTQSYQPNWLERLMGVQIVKAHSVPSDWWSVPLSGGAPTRLTQIQSTNLYANMAPDHHHLVSFDMDGLFVMELDGSNLTSLFPDPGGSTVNWLP